MSLAWPRRGFGTFLLPKCGSRTSCGCGVRVVCRHVEDGIRPRYGLTRVGSFSCWLTDTYFAVPDPLDLHMYVCLAILTNCKDALEELDQSEAKSMLFSLPPLDVDRVRVLLGSA